MMTDHGLSEKQMNLIRDIIVGFAPPLSPYRSLVQEQLVLTELILI